MDKPYNRNKHWKKNNESKSSISQTHTTFENTKSNKNSKNIKKNDLKGGSILENHQDQNINYITIARKTVDNV